MMKIALLLTALLAPVATQAQPAFTGPDYSGVYDCTGNDAHEGPYTGTVTMELDAAQSTGSYGAYKFRLDVPGFGAYLGEAVSEGDRIAMYFALQDPTTHDFGTGLATVSRGADGRTSFSKFYYEPEFKGGNYGTEECMLRK
ncbi:MAG TPA: hypothetical protein PKW44_04965 [Methylophilaceae bacterium]|nr:hypothetical protein [Methylophilaceae bacterium]HQR59790.1 hypothetical protein [Methylophilaceae bacterium]